MAETAPNIYSDEYENEGIAGDGYLDVIVNRLRALGAPATEAARETNHKLAIAATVGGSALFLTGGAIGGVYFRHRHAH
jgi:hypothetical protein